MGLVRVIGDPEAQTFAAVNATFMAHLLNDATFEFAGSVTVIVNWLTVKLPLLFIKKVFAVPFAIEVFKAIPVGTKL